MVQNATPLRPDAHRELQSLLPWYVIGRLEASERSRVEAHLELCAECRGELVAERRLASGVSALPTKAGLDVAHGWSAVRRLVERERPSHAMWLASVRAALRTPIGRMRAGGGGRPWMGWALAAQFCVVIGLGAVVWRDARPAAPPYHALSSAPVTPAANVAVIFRPETPEKSLREILQASDARLVGGPTVTDAYLLHVPAPDRNIALERLRRRAEVVLAEPIDQGVGQ